MCLHSVPLGMRCSALKEASHKCTVDFLWPFLCIKLLNDFSIISWKCGWCVELKIWFGFIMAILSWFCMLLAINLNTKTKEMETTFVRTVRRNVLLNIQQAICKGPYLRFLPPCLTLFKFPIQVTDMDSLLERLLACMETKSQRSDLCPAIVYRPWVIRGFLCLLNWYT